MSEPKPAPNLAAPAWVGVIALILGMFLPSEPVVVVPPAPAPVVAPAPKPVAPSIDWVALLKTILANVPRTTEPLTEPAPVGPLYIDGPDVCLPGEQIELKAVGDAKWVRWAKIAPFAGPYNADRVVVFTSQQPGVFTFSIAGDVNGKGEGDEHVVTVGTPKPPVVVTPDKPPVVQPDPTTKATRATYVYEQRRGSPPPPVLAALSRLNVPGGFVASAIDQDVISGKGQVPAQYAAALEAAKKAGLPCLVVEYTVGLPKVVPAPKTAAEVEGAVK